MHASSLCMCPVSCCPGEGRCGRLYQRQKRGWQVREKPSRCGILASIAAAPVAVPRATETDGRPPLLPPNLVIRSVVSFDLIGSGKMTEQELKITEGTELVALSIPRPMGIIFEERKLCACGSPSLV